jgi:subtilisin family serine protease
MNTRSIRLLFVAILTVTSGAVLSSDKADVTKVDPYLLEVIEDAENDKILDVTLKLRHQADIPALLEKLQSRSASRGERHREVVRALQAAREVSQPSIVEELDRLRSAGRVVSFKGYWISNIIEVRCRAEAVRELSVLDGIETVYLTPKAVPVGVEMDGESPFGADGAEPGPLVIGADSLWRLGITGASRVVGHIDTGVDGNHPALSERWRGNFEPPEECWLAPGTVFPFDSSGHGTATMGVLLGRDSSTGDTTGVAIDALWISARFGLDPNSVSTTEALQWMADPDGNPETYDDVPDVVSNSWVYIPETECYQTDWIVIDNLEAAGACVMFSAGNAGSSPQTVASPGSRNANDINGFAVGAVDNNKRIANFSSRG